MLASAEGIRPLLKSGHVGTPSSTTLVVVVSAVVSEADGTMTRQVYLWFEIAPFPYSFFLDPSSEHEVPNRGVLVEDRFGTGPGLVRVIG